VRDLRQAALVLAALLVVLGDARSQDPSAPAPPGSGLSAAQLDQLTAPIALYPDPLLGSVLVASTYPLEVVEAGRWLDDPAHAALAGDQLVAALEQQSWDTSVKSLVSFPQVLRMMNANLEWTEQLGDAFLAQQAEVMDSVQRLRQQAAAGGALQSTPQQTIATEQNDEQNDISIEPASPDVVYVPCYGPAVYGPWPWPGYPPYYFADTDCAIGVIGFGIPIWILEPYWGWYRWNWPGHGLWVEPHHPRPGAPTREPEGGPRLWQHDPAHRGGVPYRDPATAARYLGSDAASRRPFRGFPSETPAPLPSQRLPPAPRQQPAPPESMASPPLSPPVSQPSLEATRPTPPAFESFGRGQQVRGESARGSSSRSMSGGGFHGGGMSGGHR
jgi:uncharacterized membrane protein YgcG